MNANDFPQWAPQVAPGSRILVVGASGGIGSAVAAMLLAGPEITLGAHRDSAPGAVLQNPHGPHTVFDLQAHLASDANCRDLVDRFFELAGGLDGLVVLAGSMEGRTHWRELEAADWEQDIQANLNVPFYLARAAMGRMHGGAVVLTGTESALHGGSPTSFPYGVAKRGTECLVQGLAREGASKGITVNGVRLGYIRSGTHERWQGKNEEDMDKRAAMVLLKRGGEPEEAAALMVYLLSGWARFITGQMLPLTGGDWL